MLGWSRNPASRTSACTGVDTLKSCKARRCITTVVSEVIAELRTQLDAAESAGVPAEKLIIDPGLGFAKTAEHNWQLLQRLGEFTVLGRPMLTGAIPQDISRQALGGG